MRREPKGILALNWMGKDDALIPVENGKYDYAWVDPADPRAREVKSIEIIDTVGDADGPTGAGENLLIVGDSGDALRSLGSIPEYAQRYLGKVKLVYIDPPFNTDQTFDNYVDQLEHSIWLTMMRDRILAIRETQVYEPRTWRHFISGVQVTGVEDDVVKARANFLITEAMSDRDPTVFVVGRFVDTLVRRGDRLLFRERIAVCDNHHIRRSIIMPI